MMSLQAAKELRQTVLWEEFCKELDNRISVAFSKMRTCKPHELPGLQLKLSVYEEVKQIPDDVVDRNAD